MKVTIEEWNAVALWRWDMPEEDVCGICRVQFDARAQHANTQAMIAHCVSIPPDLSIWNRGGANARFSDGQMRAFVPHGNFSEFLSIGIGLRKE